MVDPKGKSSFISCLPRQSHRSCLVFSPHRLKPECDMRHLWHLFLTLTLTIKLNPNPNPCPNPNPKNMYCHYKLLEWGVQRFYSIFLIKEQACMKKIPKKVKKYINKWPFYQIAILNGHLPTLQNGRPVSAPIDWLAYHNYLNPPHRPSSFPNHISLASMDLVW